MKLFLKTQILERIKKEIDLEIFGFLANKHIVFYRILNLQEIEIERILGAEMDLKIELKINKKNT